MNTTKSPKARIWEIFHKKVKKLEDKPDLTKNLGMSEIESLLVALFDSMCQYLDEKEGYVTDVQKDGSIKWIKKECEHCFCQFNAYFQFRECCLCGEEQ